MAGPLGCDAAKGIKGRKRHLLVDTLGLVLAVQVTPASTPERAGAKALLSGALGGQSLAAPALGGRRVWWPGVCPVGPRAPPQADGGGGQALR